MPIDGSKEKWKAHKMCTCRECSHDSIPPDLPSGGSGDSDFAGF